MPSCQGARVRACLLRRHGPQLAGRSYPHCRDICSVQSPVRARLPVVVTDPSGGILPGVLQVGLDDSSLELQAQLDEEFAQLSDDRNLLHSPIFPRTCPSLPPRQRIVQNAMHISISTGRKMSDFELAYIVDFVRELFSRLTIVRSEGSLSKEG